MTPDPRPLSADQEWFLREETERGNPMTPAHVTRLLATLDAERARHAALVEAAQAVCQAWIADEAGEETFDPNLIDALGDALYGKPEDRAALIEEARK